MARLVSQDDVGIGSIFLLLVTLMDMISSLRSEILILQAADGDEPELSGSVHWFEFTRGLAIALLTFALARPAATWFGVPEATWAFRVVGVVPLLTGLIHQDTVRYQRKFRYGPSIWVEVVPQVVATALAWPLAVWLGDYSAILWLIVIRGALTSVISHLVASRPYRWNLDRQRFRQIVKFGWPLLANGLLMFAIIQGDRLIIGSKYSHYTLADLGLYAMAWNVTNAISSILARTGSPLIPLFSQEREEPQKLAHHYGLSCQLTAVIGAAFGILFVLLGGVIMGWVYGSSYSSAGSFIGWLAAASACRSLRIIPTAASMAFADTRNLLLANMFRSTSLIGSTAAAFLGADLVWIAIAAFGGEVVALFPMLVRLRRVTGIRPSLCMYPFAFLVAWIAVAWTLHSLLEGYGPVAACVLCLAVLVAMVVVGAAVFPALRRQVATSIPVRGKKPETAGTRDS